MMYVLILNLFKLKGNKEYLTDYTMAVKARNSHITKMNLNKSKALTGINNSGNKTTDFGSMELAIYD